MFTNSIMIIHVNRIANQPPMSLIVVQRYRNIDAKDPRGGYRELFVIIAGIPDHRNGHFVKPNKVALK